MVRAAWATPASLASPNSSEVPAGAEVWAFAGQDDAFDGGVLGGERKGFAEGVAHGGGVGVALLGAVQEEVEFARLAVDEDRWVFGFPGGWLALAACEPALEFGAVLEGGVGEGFCNQAVWDG